MQWYYRIGDQTEGPVDDSTIQQQVRDGKIGRQDLVRNERMGEQWVPLRQFPNLAALSPEARQPDPEHDIEIHKHLAVAEQQQRRRLAITVGIVAAVASLAIAGISASIHAKLRAPYRALGITQANPIGSFDEIDRALTGELQMDRRPVTRCAEIDRTAPSIYSYANPKAPRGKYVGPGGTITVLADGQRVLGVCVTFISPGERAGTFYNPSVCSLWGEKLWRLVNPKRVLICRPLHEWPEGTLERTGLDKSLPRDGVLAVHDGDRSRGCWYEYSPDGLQTVIFLEPKDAPEHAAAPIRNTEEGRQTNE